MSATARGALSADYSQALTAAQAAAGNQCYPAPALYMVATPIGNLADITLRALQVLQLADTVACEDTRHTAQLLRHYGIAAAGSRLLALHQHNEQQAAAQVLQRLQAGQRVAYVSDAGTPGVSDPGGRLVAQVRAAGHRVVPLPGASSITTALSAAGLHHGPHANGVAGLAHGWVFAGFLPTRAQERQQLLQALQHERRAVVLLEAPHRIAALAQDLALLEQRPLTVARELSKQFETIETLPARAFAAWLEQDPDRSRGEFVLVLHALEPEEAGAETGANAEHQRILRLLLADLPTKSAVKLAAEITGAPRNALYQQALALRQEPD